MMKLILALLLSVSAWAQITASPTAINLYMRQGQPYPNNSTMDPADQTVTISGSGAWTAVRSGGLTTACDGGQCYTLSAGSGSGAGSITADFTGHGAETLAPGAFTGTLTVGSTAIAVSITVQPRNPFDFFVYPAGYPVGCTGPSAGYQTTQTCTPTTERPTSTGFSIPTAGNTYVDPQFGHTVRRVTPSGQNIQYGALSAISATGIYVLTSDNSGNVDVYTAATGVEAYGNLPGININGAAWHPTDDNILYYMDGVSIKYRNLSAGTVTTAATYGASITMGGTVDITDDGWWGFHDYTNICAVNLNGLTTGTQAAKTFCTALAPFSVSDIDFTQITQVDSESGKRYVVCVCAPSTFVLSVNLTTGVLDFENNLSVGEPHSDVGQDEKGRQLFFWNWDEPNGNQTYIGAIQLSKGVLSQRPVEEGGGLRIYYMSTGASGTTDAHFGCTWRGMCVYTPYGNSGGIAAAGIQSITAANPCQINSTAHGYSSTNSVLIGGAAGTGVSLLNGVHTVTVLNANAYTIPVDCFSGYTYTADSANSTLNTASAVDSPFRQTILASRMGQEVWQVAVHRTKTYNGGTLSSYYATPRASISRDGSMIAYASNYGIPELSSVWVAYTGITSAQDLKVAANCADTECVLSYVFPAGFTVGTAAIEISTKPDPSDSPTVDVFDGLSSQARQYIATGLTAGTQYYYRVCSLGFCDTGQFRTAPSLSGTGRLQIAKGGGGSISWGYTTGMTETPCTSPCDIAPTKGIVYHNATGAASAVVVR